MGQPTAVEPTLVLPFPPSVNHYWKWVVRHRRPTPILTDRAKKYRADVEEIVLRRYGFLEPTTARLRVFIVAVMPDRRERDLDNLHKGPLDALTHSRVWKSDKQIDDLRITRSHVEAPGRLEVTIYKIPSAQKELSIT